MIFDSITKPAFLVDETQARENIRVMNEKAKVNNVNFRPHFKSHFSADISEWYKEVGVKKITVSSIDMAVYFAKHGWHDITVAFPVNVLEIKTLNELASKIILNLVVESIDTVLFLNQNLKFETNFWLKIDTGYGRTGIDWKNNDLIKGIISSMENPLKFQGLLAHFGHTYKERDNDVIKNIYKTGVYRLSELKKGLLMENCQISVGDTPSCSLVENFGEVDEIRPGNFIFYDLMQEQIGSCKLGQISVCMVCPVVSVHPERNEIVVHGGAVHFSKDSINNKVGKSIYGKIVSLNENGWSDSVNEMIYLKSLSQEHGIVSATDEFINKIKVGDLIGILPTHSCLTANLMKDYLTLDGTVLKSMNSVV